MKKRKLLFSYKEQKYQYYFDQLIPYFKRVNLLCIKYRLQWKNFPNCWFLWQPAQWQIILDNCQGCDLFVNSNHFVSKAWQQENPSVSYEISKVERAPRVKIINSCN